MIKRALLLLLLTAAWAFGCWWYYTCMIKGFCRADSAPSTSEEVKSSALTATTAGAMIAAGKSTPQDTQPKTTEFVDQDGDAISDEDERALGTDPTKEDSDGDGIKDNEELGVDLLNPIDTDSDGIINALDEDDDGDGIPTQLESTFSSNPLSADSDGDGVNDGDEVGTDTNNPLDTDSDGIIDLIDSIDDRAEATDSKSDTAPPQTAEEEKTPTEANNAEDSKSEPTEAKDEVTVDTTPTQQSAESDGSIPIQKSRLYFPFRSANPGLSKAATTYFQGVVTWLNQNPSHSVVLTGHTDDIGKAKNNLDLGLKRAIEIKDMMTKLGASSAQVEVASMGETQPIASNKTDEGRRKNRRVELIPAIKQ